jgi:hypothetical protein
VVYKSYPYKCLVRVRDIPLANTDKSGRRTHWAIFIDAVKGCFKYTKKLNISAIPLIKSMKTDWKDLEMYDDTFTNQFESSFMDEIVRWVAPDIGDKNSKYIVQFRI